MNSQIQGQAGTQLPTTLTMLANNPDIDFPTRPPEKRNPNYNLSDLNRSYQGTDDPSLYRCLIRIRYHKYDSTTSSKKTFLK